MRRIAFLCLLLPACTTTAVRCDAHLQAINPPVQRAVVAAPATRSAR